MEPATIFAITFMAITANGPTVKTLPIIFPTEETCKEFGKKGLSMAVEEMNKRQLDVEWAAYQCVKFENVPLGVPKNDDQN